MKKKLYKALRAGLKSQYDGSAWKLGEWRKTKCTKLCHGFNCSEKIIDAMRYFNMEILAEVEVKGKHFLGDDKQTWEEMRIIKAWYWTKKDNVELAVYAAELVLDIWAKKYPDDDRPQKAIQAAKTWLAYPTEKNRKAVDMAAGAARVAAWVAWVATRAESRVVRAADTAAWMVTRAESRVAKVADTAALAARTARTARATGATAVAATRSAWAVAGEAGGETKGEIERWIQNRIKTLEPYKEEKCL